MGMGIYIFREKRVNGKWIYFGDFPYEGQDPDLIGWLDDTYESPYKAIAKTRGFPVDIAIETRSRIERIAGEDGCGVSYLQFKEILNNVDGDIKKQEHFEDFICNIRYMCENEDPADHRLVFCFV